MDDLVIKMESIFGVKRFVSDQPMQYVLSPSDLIDDLINFLPQIMQCFNQVMGMGNHFMISMIPPTILVLFQLANHLNVVVSGAESDRDAELFTDELNYTKICIGLCLRLFAAFFTWSNFQQEEHKPLLRGSFANRKEKFLDNMILF